MIIFRIAKKFNNILTKHQKVRIAELFIMMIIGGFMEMLSVALIIPFMQTMLNQDSNMNNKYIILISNFVSVSYKSYLIFLAIALILICFFKNAFLVFQVTMQERFVQNNQFALQKQLFESFLDRPYEFFLTSNTGEILRIIMNDTALAFSALTTLLEFVSEMIVAIILMTTAFYIAPMIMLFMAIVIFCAVVLLVFFSKKVVRKAGEDYQNASMNMYQTLLQALEGIKVVKLSKKAGYFINMYRRDGKALIKASYINKMASYLPRYFLETIAMCGFFSVLVGLIIQGMEISVLVPAVSGVAVAALRLLPCANRITAAVTTLNYSEPAVDKLISNLSYLFLDKHEDYENAISPSRASSSKMKTGIRISNVSYKYPTGASSVFDNVTFDILKGQSVGIVGPSGSGKTTIVDIILGLLTPQSGRIMVDGIDIKRDVDGWLTQIGYIPQSLFMINGSIKENVAFGLEENEIDEEKVWKALEKASLAEFVRSLPDGIYTQIGERGVRVSGGQKQRIGIARALYNDPEILFFDEATSALDNDTEAAIMDSINHLHGTKTIIIIAHRLTTIENCDVVYRVENGEVIKAR